MYVYIYIYRERERERESHIAITITITVPAPPFCRRPPSSARLAFVSLSSEGSSSPEECSFTDTGVSLTLHTCHILPFQPILCNRCFPSKSVKSAKRSPTSISEGGRIWQVGTDHASRDILLLLL